jgi:hypothetical protein
MLKKISTSLDADVIQFAFTSIACNTHNMKLHCSKSLYMIKTPTELFFSFQNRSRWKKKNLLCLRIPFYPEGPKDSCEFSRIFPAVRHMNDREWTRGNFRGFFQQCGALMIGKGLEGIFADFSSSAAHE